MKTSRNPETLGDAIAYFRDYERCRTFVEAARWPNGVVQCPNCGSHKIGYLASVRRYKCYGKHPRSQFSLKVGTVFQDSSVGLEKWLPTVWVLTNNERGISSYKLAHALHITQKTAYAMLSRLVLADLRAQGRDAPGALLNDRSKEPSRPRNPLNIRADDPAFSMMFFERGLRRILSSSRWASRSRLHLP